MTLIQVLLALLAVALAARLLNTYIRIPPRFLPVVNLVLALIVVGIVLWVINTFIPMAESIKAILNIVVVVATCVWILQVIGLWGDIVRLWSRFTHRMPPAA
jgi:predicted membrane protein